MDCSLSRSSEGVHPETLFSPLECKIDVGYDQLCSGEWVSAVMMSYGYAGVWNEPTVKMRWKCELPPGLVLAEEREVWEVDVSQQPLLMD